MKKALDAGVLKKRFTDHDIRAKTATDDPLGAQQRLGHKSRSMTDRYVKARKVEKVKPLAKNI
jgi:integrase